MSAIVAGKEDETLDADSPLAIQARPELQEATGDRFDMELFEGDTGSSHSANSLVQTRLKTAALIDKALKRKSLGTVIGTFKGSDFIPSHDLALSIAISEDIAHVDLNKTEALKFLKKENIELPDDAPQGWVLARFEGLNLGWMKVMKNRINNYLPTEFRIRMNI